jgi:AP-3 complex subunit mu
VNLTPSIGQFLFDEPTKVSQVRVRDSFPSDLPQVAKWTIGKLTKDQSPTLNGSIIFHTGVSPHSDDAPPIQLNWKVPMASISGLAVAGLQLTNETYRPYKGVRVVTKSGKYQIRSN